MFYDISLKIGYHYQNPVLGGRHILRILPNTLQGRQTVHSSFLTLDPLPAERFEFTDFFGNAATSLAYTDWIKDTLFAITLKVEKLPVFQGSDCSPTRADLQQSLLQLRNIGPDSPHHFLSTSPRIPRNTDIIDWARTQTQSCASVYSVAQRICYQIFTDMTFDPASTAVDMPVEQAFANRRGVCQDYTHIAITALRGLGIPAAYMSGFMRTLPPEGEPRLEGADAMHAWVGVWCGEDMGWVEFDPTNNILAGEDHVLIAKGRDYFDVAPVKGSLFFSGQQTTTQSVDVIESSPLVANSDS